MARYTGAVCRLCRREGKKLNLKGARCNTPKCAFMKKAYIPGDKGPGIRRRGKVSTYGIQLRAKQEAKRTYGVLERQFRRYFRLADKTPGITGTNLLRLLETRLDNMTYRMGFAASRKSSRMLITHGHLLVNGKRVDIPSYQVKVNDVLSVTKKIAENHSVQAALDFADTIGRLDWIQWDAEKKQGCLLRIPDRDQIPTDINEQLIVELYSK